MILVYCEHITNRHRYIFDFIFKDILGSDCILTENPDEFIASGLPKINYSITELSGSLRIKPNPLLSETGVRQQDVMLNLLNAKTIKQFNSLTIDQFPFDPFALSFYLITRYEEYLPFEPDEHGRFRAELSLAYRQNFLRVPLVDVLAHQLKKMLEDRYPGLKIPGQPFRFIPSFDIDIAFAHLGKGWARAGAAWAKLFLKADIKQIKERALTIAGKIADPYDNFDLHLELAKKYGHALLYFVLIGDFSQFDRNTSYKSFRFRDLIIKLSLSAEIGLHPSYRSHLRPEIYEKEKRRLGDLGKFEVSKNRFHFLRLKFPESYRLLISQGISDDYSLGYSTMNGFRASTCTPFLFYDLEKEEITNLRIHPFIFMDSAIIDHLKLNPQDAVTEIRELADQVKMLGGEAIGIWHNYSLSEKGQYKGWQEVMRNVIEQYQYQLQ